MEGLDTDRIAQPEDEGSVLLEDGHGSNSPPQEALATPESTHPAAPSFGLLGPGSRSQTTPRWFSLNQELDAITHISPIRTGGEDAWWHMLQAKAFTSGFGRAKQLEDEGHGLL